jgi:large subunit ribosomal protein L9
MQIILFERVEKLGQMGDVVRVKDGFARNYLLPTGKAQRATKENIAAFADRRSQFETANLDRRQDAESIAARLDGQVCIMLRQASEGGQLYGSVNARDIAVAVTESGFTVARKQVILDGAIKSVGLHPIRVTLHPEVAVTVTINVARTQVEAASQAADDTETADGLDAETAEAFFDKPDEALEEQAQRAEDEAQEAQAPIEQEG